MINQGWSCPGCGKCYSPFTAQCFTCGQPTRTSTNTGSWKNLSEPKDIGFGCRHPMNCERKDGYCAKCHSEYY